MTLQEILHATGRNQDVNALINKKPFSDQLIKNKQEAYEQTCRNVNI